MLRNMMQCGQITFVCSMYVCIYVCMYVYLLFGLRFTRIHLNNSQNYAQTSQSPVANLELNNVQNVLRRVLRMTSKAICASCY